MNTSIIYNSNSIIKLLKTKKELIEKIYLIKINKKNIYIANQAKKLNIDTTYVKNIKNKNLTYIKKYNSIICKIKNNINQSNKIDDLLKDKNCSKILILDRIQDPYNFSACLRTAEAFSINTIITNEKNSAKNSSLITNISNGANFSINIIQEKDIIKTIKLLKDNKFAIIGLSSKSKDFVPNKIIDFPIAIIIGSEKNGITKSIRTLCTHLYKIKLNEKSKNINVSVAAGIILSKLTD